MKPTVELDGGRVRLWHARAEDVLPTWEAGFVDMIWTDPPYGHGNMEGDLQAARVRDGVKGARVREAEPIANDSGEDFEALMRTFLDEAARVLAPDCCCCCCCCMAGGGPNVTFARVAQEVDERLGFFQAIVWDKSARGNGMGWRYRRNYEFIMVAHRKGGRLLWADESMAVPNIVRHMPVRDRIHPNEKPVEMVRDFIRWHAALPSVIADPFMGSGPTGAAAVQLGHEFWGVEMDAAHFANAVDRIRAELSRTPLFPDPKPVQRELIQ